MRKNWLLIGIASLVAVLAIGAVACGGDDGDVVGGDDVAPTATETNGSPPIGLPTGDTSTVIVTDGILTDSAGSTLYVFDNDEPGVSNCAGDCLDIWPLLPLLPVGGEIVAGEGVTGTLATITRDDGATQVTHNGQPLYYYANDDAPGDRRGDGVGGVWHIVEVGG